MILIGSTAALGRIRRAAQAAKDGAAVRFEVEDGAVAHIVWKHGRTRHEILAGNREILQELLPSIVELFRQMSVVN